MGNKEDVSQVTMVYVTYENSELISINTISTMWPCQVSKFSTSQDQGQAEQLEIQVRHIAV
jgi:hypothetical protein